MALRLQMIGAFVLALLLTGGMFAPAQAQCSSETAGVRQVVASAHTSLGVGARKRAVPAFLRKTSLQFCWNCASGVEVEDIDDNPPEALTRPSQPSADDFGEAIAAAARPETSGAGSRRPLASTPGRPLMFSFPQDRPPNAAAA